MTAQHTDLTRGITFLAGLGLGAGLMYLLDPDRGARRRSLARDKTSHTLHAQRTLFDKGVRDLSNRVRSVYPRLRSAVLEGEVPDETLVERIRAKLGRFVSHPGSIEVTAENGHITLSGPILADEAHRLVRRVERMHGVHGVDDRLELHRHPDDVPGLQGEPRSLPRPVLLRESWPPAVRLVAVGTGLAVGMYGLRRGGRLGKTLAAGSLAVLVRAVTNRPARRLVGRRTFATHKTITIDAPVDAVFEFCRQVEQYPLFMPHVREVRITDDGGRSHWKFEGPAGATIHWDAQITDLEPGKVLAWATLPGSAVEHHGVVRFEEADGERTRLDIRMSYRPPAGVLGHAVARLFHKDPKTVLDEDMIRLQSLLEGRGVPRTLHQRAAPALPELD